MGDAMQYAGANASAAGLSIEETAAFIGVLGDAGITGSKAGTSLNAMLRDLKKNSEDGAIAVGEQSVALYDAEGNRSEEYTSELQSRGHLVCRLLLLKIQKEQ